MSLKIRKGLRRELSTFLDNDGIPSNNNNAEHAIKHFTKYRRLVSGRVTHSGVKDYLKLLSVYPGREKFAEMAVAAERAGCRDAVDRLAREFLATGKPPCSAAEIGRAHV